MSIFDPDRPCQLQPERILMSEAQWEEIMAYSRELERERLAKETSSYIVDFRVNYFGEGAGTEPNAA